MSTNPKPPGPKPRYSSEEPVERTPINVTLPPIDAEPEEIAQALFQRPPLKNRKSTPEDDCPEPDETSRA